MSNKKQSSVEWLAEQLTEYSLDKWEIKVIVQRALQMHKEEILDAWTDGYSCGVDMYQEWLGIDYYNATFGGDNE